MHLNANNNKIPRNAIPMLLILKNIQYKFQITVKKKTRRTKCNMFEGAIYLRFTFGVCPFYSDLTHRTGLNLKEKKVVTQYNSNYIVLYTHPLFFGSD